MHHRSIFEWGPEKCIPKLAVKNIYGERDELTPNTPLVQPSVEQFASEVGLPVLFSVG
jgi:hypothetical protein